MLPADHYDRAPAVVVICPVVGVPDAARDRRIGAPVRDDAVRDAEVAVADVHEVQDADRRLRRFSVEHLHFRRHPERMRAPAAEKQRRARADRNPTVNPTCTNGNMIS